MFHSDALESRNQKDGADTSQNRSQSHRDDNSPCFPLIPAAAAPRLRVMFADHELRWLLRFDKIADFMRIRHARGDDFRSIAGCEYFDFSYAEHTIEQALRYLN